jgi:hypothetical protein
VIPGRLRGPLSGGGLLGGLDGRSNSVKGNPTSHRKTRWCFLCVATQQGGHIANRPVVDRSNRLGGFFKVAPSRFYLYA